MMKKKENRYICVIFFSILSSFAILTDKQYLSNDSYIHLFGEYLCDKMNRSSMNFVCAFVFIVILYLYYKFYAYFIQLGSHKVSVLLSVLLSGIMMIGDGFTANGRLTFMIDNKYQFIVSIIVFMGYLLFFYLMACLVDDLYEKIYKKNQKRKKTVYNSRKLYFYIIIVLFVFWLPYLVAYFPGSVPHDGMTQIAQAMKVYELKNDHPVISTLLIGVFVRIGKLIGSDYAGIVIGVLFQTIFVASSFSYVLLYLLKFSNNKKLFLLAGIFFAIYPTWGMMVEAFMKDAIYVGFFAYFSVLFVRFMMNPQLFLQEIKNVVFLIESMLGICFWRVNGIYILMGILVVFLFAQMKWIQKLKMAGCFIGVFVFYFFMLNTIYPMIGVSQENNYTGMHIMLQQTARYIHYHEDEITQEEKEAISAVLDYQYVKENFNPNVTDFATTSYRNDATDEQKQAYINAWKQMFFKHPSTYVESVLNTTYQFYYIGNNNNYWGEFQNYTKYDLNLCLPDLKEIQVLAGARQAMNSWAVSVRAVPGINMLGRCGFYAWIIIILSGIFIKRKQLNKFIAMSPLYINVLLFSLVSPANGLHRYIWPVMASIPIFLALSLFESQKKEI